MNIGERIKKLRKEKGFTLEELGEKINLNRSTIHRYENNLINIPSDNLEKLAVALKTTPAYLMGWEETDTTKFLEDYDTSFLTDFEKQELEFKLSMQEGLFNNKEDLDEESKQELKRIFTKTYLKLKKMDKEKEEKAKKGAK